MLYKFIDETPQNKMLNDKRRQHSLGSGEICLKTSRVDYAYK